MEVVLSSGSSSDKKSIPGMVCIHGIAALLYSDSKSDIDAQKVQANDVLHLPSADT